MKIKKITIKNYRGIKTQQEIPLSNFSSIIGRNDSGKSIVLNAIATFLDTKGYPVVESDFNDPTKPIFFECHFTDNDLRELLESKIKSKVRKTDGLEEFLNDIIVNGSVIFQKEISQAGKSAQKENIIVRDYENTDFQDLYEKNDEELNVTLEKYNINIPVEGKGRNSKLEKIKYIKEYCNENSLPIFYKPIQDAYKVSSLFPAIELFVSDYGLKADTSFKTNSVSEIQDYFVRETSDNTKKLKQVETEIQQEMNVEAEAIKTYMLAYTSSLKRVEIIPNIIWKDAIKSVEVSFQFSGDSKPIPMDHKGTGYRRLFMVARFRYLAEKSKGNNIIYLIEEPETYLHPSAQEDLLNSFKELSEDNQIIITTHSPVFAGSTDYDSVVLCKKDEESVYECCNEENKTEFIYDIVEELGIKPSYNLRDNYEKIVFVESKNDGIFYDCICRKVFGCNFLSNDKILVLPFGGTKNIDGFVNINYFSKSGRDLYLIIDSDKCRKQEVEQQQRIEEFDKREKCTGYMLRKSCIENYYHPRAFERVYSLPVNTFDFINDTDNARSFIKEIIQEKDLKNKNIKEKNNRQVFEETSKEEWEEVLEQELITFLEKIAQ